MNEIPQKTSNKEVAVITTAAFVSIFTYSFVVSLPGLLINDVVEAFSLRGAQEGLMGTMTSVGVMLSLFFTILVQGRAKKTTVLICTFALQAIMLVICGFSPTFIIFLAGCVFIGFCGGFIDTFSNSAIVDARGGESTKYLGYLHGLFGVGSLLVPIIFIWTLSYIDWRGVHYALAIISCFVMLLIFTLAQGKTKERREAAVREHLFAKADLLAYIKVKRNAMLALTGFFSMYTIAGIFSWIVRYMVLQYDAAEIGALSLTVYWVCSTVNRFLLTSVVNRAPMKYFALGSVLSGVFLLIGIFSGSPIVFCVMMGVFGLFSGHFVPVLVSECAMGYEGRTTFSTSCIIFVMSLSRIAAPVMIAFVSTQVSLTVGILLPVITIFVSALFGWLAVKS